ncbi:alpha/beta hydrolase [Paraburkholderia sp.]|uniref:alpha/beta hydrolase n=1 Tax=Paraburkholderia sp. TaxID=1926495 RepID=UPI003D7012CA
MTSRTRHLVDKELLDLLDASPTVSVTAETLTAFRASRAVAYPCREIAGAADVEVSVQYAKGMAGSPDVEFRLYRPSGIDTLAGCVLHIHGGGFVRGAAITGDARHRSTVAALGCVLVSVDYRLAPETRFPGNLEDCYAVLSWIFRHADELSIDTRKVGVMGESAGGGLAACLCLLARDRREFSLAFQHLMYPMLDDRTCMDPAPHPFAGEFVWTRQSNVFGWSSLLGETVGTHDVSPYAAAARASDPGGLPPAFMCVGTLDLFVDEDLDYARRLALAGIPVECHVYPGAVHGFDYHPTARVATAAREVSFRALEAFLER